MGVWRWFRRNARTLRGNGGRALYVVRRHSTAIKPALVLYDGPSKEMKIDVSAALLTREKDLLVRLTARLGDGAMASTQLRCHATSETTDLYSWNSSENTLPRGAPEALAIFLGARGAVSCGA